MMPPAEQDQIRHRGRAATRPVLHVMPLRDARPAARESTGLIAMMQGAPQGGGNRARAGADHDLIPLAGRPGVEFLMERRLREQH